MKKSKKILSVFLCLCIFASCLIFIIISKDSPPKTPVSDNPKAVLVGATLKSFYSKPSPSKGFSKTNTVDFPILQKPDYKPPVKPVHPFDENGFVYYRQDGSEFNNIKYGDYTLGSHGCGPVNLAMIYSTLKKEKISPVDLARYAEKRGMIGKTGTAYALIDESAKLYGVNVRAFSKSKKDVLLSALEEGKPVLTVVGPGIFSRGGHFLTFRGITKDKKILIADSISPERTKREWDFDVLYGQMRDGAPFWVFNIK